MLGPPTDREASLSMLIVPLYPGIPCGMLALVWCPNCWSSLWGSHHDFTSLLQASQQELTVKESERAEAASLLGRRMTAMEAILAARRAVKQDPASQTEVEAAREGGGEMRFQVCLSPSMSTPPPSSAASLCALSSVKANLAKWATIQTNVEAAEKVAVIYASRSVWVQACQSPPPPPPSPPPSHSASPCAVCFIVNKGKSCPAVRDGQ